MLTKMVDSDFEETWCAFVSLCNNAQKYTADGPATDASCKRPMPEPGRHQERLNMVQNLTDEQLVQSLDMVEAMIHGCKDVKNLPSLSDTFKKLLDEQVRRDMLVEKSGEPSRSG